jgi:hypothetical protein
MLNDQLLEHRFLIYDITIYFCGTFAMETYDLITPDKAEDKAEDKNI